MKKKPEHQKPEPQAEVFGVFEVGNDENSMINNTDNVEFENAYFTELENAEEFRNAYYTEFDNQKVINAENVEAIKNKNVAQLNDSVETLTENLQIEDIINKELAKFVENADLNKKTRSIESPGFELCVENEHSNNATLDVENVYKCVSKAGLSEISF